MSEVRLISEIPFHDVKVKVLYHPNNKEEECYCTWQCRNPDSVYTGPMYMNNETGEITYPEGTVIPERTKEDMRILPMFIITGLQKLSESSLDKMKSYLEQAYKIRNKL